jgi:AraC family transcriptional regulator
MSVTTTTVPGWRLAAIRHVGPYNQIGRVFGQLHGIVTAASLPHRELLAVFYDDPATTPAEQLRSDAAVIVDEGVKLPAGVVEQRIPAGQYLTTDHHGSYEKLTESWGRFKREIAEATGQRDPRGYTFELYRNTPMDTPEDKLLTTLYMAVAGASRTAAP